MERLDIKDTQTKKKEKEITFFRYTKDLNPYEQLSMGVMRYLAARKVGVAGEERDFLEEAVAIANGRSLLLPEWGHVRALHDVLCEQWKGWRKKP